MPPLDNPRHEAFAQALVAGMKGKTRIEQAQSTAYRAAGYRAKEGNASESSASRLLRRGKHIFARVRELQEEERKRRGLTINDIVNELEEARGIAASKEHASAMVAASSAKAKILGLEVTRIESGKPGSFDTVQCEEDLADALLRQVSPGISVITDDMREMALASLRRHAAELKAIASGDAGALAS